MNFSWSAIGPDGQTIQGPSGTGMNEWRIANGDLDTANDWLKWKPGKWKILTQVGSATSEFEQEIGWRTEDYAIIGQIVQTNTHISDRPGTLGSAWQFRRAITYDIGDWFSDDLKREAVALLPIPPEAFTGPWVLYWAFLKSHEQTPQGPFTKGRLLPIFGQYPTGEVLYGHRFWMVQTGLNMAPDQPEVDDQYSASALEAIRQAGEFRIMHRYQAKFSVDNNGNVIGLPITVGEHVSDEGITKGGFGFVADQFYPGSPAIEPVTFPFMESETNGWMKHEGHKAAKLSGYCTARIGEKGRNVNWRLFGLDAPWIFSEIVHEVKPDRTVETTVRTSVDVSWKDGSIIQGATPFNNLSIYKAIPNQRQDGSFAVTYEREPDGLLEMEGKLERFINSVSGRWPEPDIPPSVR
jgi:hypothetical protein